MAITPVPNNPGVVSAQGVQVTQASTPASAYETVVQQLYVSYFGRPADPLGLQYFESMFASVQAPTTVAELAAGYNTNPTVKAIIDTFGVSPESQTLYGAGNSASFVTHIYQSVLGRDPEPDGLAFWSLLVDQGRITRASLALTIASTAAINGSNDSKVFANKIDAATLFTKNLDTTNEILSYDGLVASQLARTMLSNVKEVPATLATITNTINSVVDLKFPPVVVPDPAPIISSDPGPWTPPPPGDPFWGP